MTPGPGSDPLQRFVDAQDRDGTWEQALRELRAGRKRNHWVWFVLPQVQGLGRSETARRYALSGADEARALLAHPVLGPRLLACVDALLALPDADPVVVLGDVDAVKVRSSMTLFALACPQVPGFAEVLRQWYGGVRDPATERALADQA